MTFKVEPRNPSQIEDEYPLNIDLSDLRSRTTQVVRNHIIPLWILADTETAFKHGEKVHAFHDLFNSIQGVNKGFDLIVEEHNILGLAVMFGIPSGYFGAIHHSFITKFLTRILSSVQNVVIGLINRWVCELATVSNMSKEDWRVLIDKHWITLPRICYLVFAPYVIDTIIGQDYHVDLDRAREIHMASSDHGKLYHPVHRLNEAYFKAYDECETLLNDKLWSTEVALLQKDFSNVMCDDNEDGLQASYSYEDYLASRLQASGSRTKQMEILGSDTKQTRVSPPSTPERTAVPPAVQSTVRRSARVRGTRIKYGK